MSKLDQVREAGRQHGLNAASWYFDGNTDEVTYVRTLEGIEEGDPAIMETLPSSPLSGEWADDPTPATLQANYGLTDDELDEACDVYEDAFCQASHDAIVETARKMTLDV